MIYQKMQAKANSYNPIKRLYYDIRYVILHNTGNDGDTAVNNARYFAKTNDKKTGTHFIIDQEGKIFKSVDLCYSAYSVGGDLYTDVKQTGGGLLYGTITNANSISIELCDIVNKDASNEMILAIAKTLHYIREHCPNAKAIYRHFDVNGKHCPQRYMDNAKWDELLNKILFAYYVI